MFPAFEAGPGVPLGSRRRPTQRRPPLRGRAPCVIVWLLTVVPPVKLFESSIPARTAIRAGSFLAACPDADRRELLIRSPDGWPRLDTASVATAAVTVSFLRALGQRPSIYALNPTEAKVSNINTLDLEWVRDIIPIEASQG